MSEAYRINIRLRMDEPKEREAAEYLRDLDQSRTEFIVDAILARIHPREVTLENIQNIVHTELQSVALPAPQKPADMEQDSLVLQGLEAWD